MELNQLMSADEFSLKVETYYHKTGRIIQLYDAVLSIAEQHSIESEDIKHLITKQLKLKLKEEALELNLIKGTKTKNKLKCN